MVGTPAKKMPCRCISAMACAASKRSTSTRVAAEANPAFICTVEPKVWNSGKVTGDDRGRLRAVEQPHRSQGVEHQIGVSQLRPFGAAGGAAGIQHHRGVAFERRRRSEFGSLLGYRRAETLPSSGNRSPMINTSRHCSAFAAARSASSPAAGRCCPRNKTAPPPPNPPVIVELCAFKQNIQRHHHRAAFENAVIDSRKLRPVRAGQRHPFTGPHAARANKFATRLAISLSAR